VWRPAAACCWAPSTHIRRAAARTEAPARATARRSRRASACRRPTAPRTQRCQAPSTRPAHTYTVYGAATLSTPAEIMGLIIIRITD
jgi:hypothetical protein